MDGPGERQNIDKHKSIEKQRIADTLQNMSFKNHKLSGRLKNVDVVIKNCNAIYKRLAFVTPPDFYTFLRVTHVCIGILIQQEDKEMKMRIKLQPNGNKNMLFTGAMCFKIMDQSEQQVKHLLMPWRDWSVPSHKNHVCDYRKSF